MAVVSCLFLSNFKYRPNKIFLCYSNDLTCICRALMGVGGWACLLKGIFSYIEHPLSMIFSWKCRFFYTILQSDMSPITSKSGLKIIIVESDSLFYGAMKNILSWITCKRKIGINLICVNKLYFVVKIPRYRSLNIPLTLSVRLVGADNMVKSDTIC